MFLGGFLYLLSFGIRGYSRAGWLSHPQNATEGARRASYGATDYIEVAFIHRKLRGL